MPGKRSSGIISQVAVLFSTGVVLIGRLTAMILYHNSITEVRSELRERAAMTARDLEHYLGQYPARDWLLGYWYAHYDELDIEYEVAFSEEAKTREKCLLLQERHPDFLQEYATEREILALPAEDQRLYAEIVYAWLIRRIDDMEANFDTAYLFCIVTDPPYDEQFVLFIAPGELLERMSGSVASFVEDTEPFDDLTMLCLTYRG